MRVLTVPNWSFGRDRRLLADCRDLLEGAGVEVHFCESDVDHNRTVTAFSGPEAKVAACLDGLAERILPAIDLNRHIGVHPRIGGLDVCPFLPLHAPEPGEAEAFKAWIELWAAGFADRWSVPVFLYERSERGRHESDLPTLRKGGFGGLLERTLRPDFGPERAHPHLGATVVGWRDFLIAMNVNLRPAGSGAAESIAQGIRRLRADGDERMLGVRALGFQLASRELSQVSLNVTLPDLTPVDPIIEHVAQAAAQRGTEVAYTELIGVIRRKDLPGARLLVPRPEQVVDAP
jgi:glutamate formiminotransferase